MADNAEDKNSAKKKRPTPSRRSKKNEPKKQKRELQAVLNLSDVTCGVCLSLLIEPVTLPCDHSLCHSCYLSVRAECNLTCPNCRLYIGGYCRKTARDKNAVNEKFWARIQTEFPEQVKARMEGKDDDIDDIVPVAPVHQLAEPGDLRKEFEKQQEELQRQEQERKAKEDAASAAILAELEREQAEERARLAELERIRLADEALALELSAHLEHLHSPATLTPPSTRKRPRKASSDSAKHTPVAKRISTFFPTRAVPNENDEPSGPSAFVPVTEHLPQCSKDSGIDEARGGCSSGTSSESLDGEVSKRLHFRPINAAPLTPPKQSPNSGNGSGQIVKPQVVPGAAAKNLNLLYDVVDLDDGDENHNKEPVAGGSGLAEELLAMERQWLRKKKEQEEADREMARRLQEELNAEERQRLVVNRRKGSQDPYLLRAKSSSNSKKQPTIEDAFQPRPTTSRSNTSRP